MIPKVRNISYDVCLKEYGLTTLESRKLREDQIEVFKILNGYENIDRNIFFIDCVGASRANIFKKIDIPKTGVYLDI